MRLEIVDCMFHSHEMVMEGLIVAKLALEAGELQHPDIGRVLLMHSLRTRGRMSV